MVTEMEVFESPDLTPLDFCLWAWMNCEFYKMKVDTRDELLGDILDTAAWKKRDQLKQLAICVPSYKVH